MELRPYQSTAVASLFSYFEASDGNPLIVIPTAGGKSWVQAEFIRQTLARWPHERFLLVSHVKELLEQNSAKLRAIGIDTAIYSAGLGSKQVGQITVAGIQSIYKRAHELGDVSIVIIDEAHLLSKNSTSMYRKFLEDLRRFCPHVKVIGMTATPFRLDSGPLHRGDGRLFTDIAYQISIKELIGQGYLCNLVTAKTDTRPNMREVKRRGGEYIPHDLEAALNKDSVTGPALDEVERLAADRRSWLVFCVGVDHARTVCDQIRKRGYLAEVILGDTPAAERALYLEQFKAGQIRALVSVGVLTTGFDAPNVDCLVCLRPTCSPGLWIQIVGRATRINPGKNDALILDFTNNTRVHGPIDQIEIDGDGNVKKPSDREQLKVCPECQSPVAVQVRQCPDCGFEFRAPERKLKHGTTASADDILSVAPISKPVKSWLFVTHKKQGKPDSLRVEYKIDLATSYREWLCFEHGGYSAEKANRWWLRRGGRPPWPRSTSEALSRVGELSRPENVMIRKNGKYWEVI